MIPRAAILVLTLTAAAPPVAAEPGAVAAPLGAASCSGCHSLRPGVGAAMPPLFGRPSEEVAAAMLAYRAGERPATVMDRIARGFSEEEIRAIAVWAAEQRP